ncbi:hypothetical protein QWZ13_00290 [Reinekea marina]|uniref:hypothetical protein n=1 Tax=Reinekea marina TaxID=1310421 RepID=UPI0025B3C670|nr:hypothetical protein [Reinekea marina]MDN3647340.1 hypothetical protein [Reinekea marina]
MNAANTASTIVTTHITTSTCAVSGRFILGLGLSLKYGINTYFYLLAIRCQIRAQSILGSLFRIN